MHLEMVENLGDQHLLAASFKVLTAPAIPRLLRVPKMPSTRRSSPLTLHFYRPFLALVGLSVIVQQVMNFVLIKVDQLIGQP
jgi:hypothetical protein